MNAKDSGSPTSVRYQPDEKLPATHALGLGLQLAVLNIAAIMLIPTVVMRAAGASEAYLSWAVLASVAIGGVTTMLQAFRIGRVGAGHVLVMGASGAFIPVCITAVAENGPAMLATLVVISSFVPLVLSWRLSLFQRILTPTVSGTVIMLIPTSVMPVVGNLLSNVPDGSPTSAAPVSFLATVLVIGSLTLKAPVAVRLWAPVIGVVAGSLIAGSFGLYDVERVARASWLDIPTGQPPGFNFDFGPAFWALLPGFLLVAVIAAIRTISSSIAIQRVSWRQRRAVDFRTVQGAVTVDGLGNLLSGLAGTVPGTALSVSVSMTELTGVAARSVGLVTGAAFLAFAFLPKGSAAMLAIPDPVFAGYLAVLLAMLFAIGIKLVVHDGVDYHEGLVVGFAFLIGIGCQYGLLFPNYVSEFAGGLLRNGITAGGFAAILITLFMRLMEPRPARLDTAFDLSALPKIRDFLGGFASRSGWDAAMMNRLDAAGEETLLTLLRQDEPGTGDSQRRMLLAARKEKGCAVLEFIVTPRDENFQDRLALLGEQTGEIPTEREVSLRLLQHLASSVHHQQYHDTDIVTVRVNPPMPPHEAQP